MLLPPEPPSPGDPATVPPALPPALPVPLPLPMDAGNALADTGLTGEAVVAAAAAAAATRAWAPRSDGEFIVPSPLPPHGLVATFAKACLSWHTKESPRSEPGGGEGVERSGSWG